MNISEYHYIMTTKIMADVIGWCDDKREDDMTLVILKRKNLES